MKDYSDKMLRPHSSKIGIVGTTGSGKTETTCMFTTFDAENIIARAVGETNSTLTERWIVFSERHSQEIIVAVKKKEKIYPRNDFKRAVINAFTRVIKKHGRQAMVDHDSLVNDFVGALNEEMNTVVNTRAILTFIDPTDLNSHIHRLVQLITDIDDPELYYTLYQTAKNQLLEKEKKDNSAKLSAVIKIEVGKYLNDQLPSDAFNELWDVWEKLNLQLDELFFRYFSKEQQSIDGYYYYIVDLNHLNESNAFIDAFFTSNNLRLGEKLSIEVFCEEIILYTPLNPEITQILKQYGDVFIDRNGYVTIALLDTKGIFHSNQELDMENEGENFDESHFNDLLYNYNYDALLFVCPLFGDTNKEKFKNLCSEVLVGFNKQIPIFMLQNKVDLFIDNENKQLNPRGRFYKASERAQIKVDVKQVMDKIDHASQMMIEDLECMQSQKRRNEKIIPLTCYLRLDDRHEEEFLEKYDPLNAIKTMFDVLNNRVKHTSKKFKIVLEPDYEDIQLRMNSEQFELIVSSALKSLNMDTKVYKPAVKNIEDNIGIRPHGSGLNAVRRKLQIGIGHTSNINESYFVNCKSFNLDLPGILRNLISNDLIQRVLNETLEIEGGKFVESVESKNLIDLIARYFDSYSFVANILFHRAYLNAENKGYFDNQKLFTAFLKNSIPYSTGYHDEQTVVFKEELETAIHKAIHLHVYYV